MADAVQHGQDPVEHAAVDHAPDPADFALMDSATAPAARDGISERDARMLDLERQWWKYAGAKEQAIRDMFDLSATHYYQVLNALIDTDAALAYDPMLVKRLRRLRTSRQQARSARRLGN